MTVTIDQTTRRWTGLDLAPMLIAGLLLFGTACSDDTTNKSDAGSADGTVADGPFADAPAGDAALSQIPAKRLVRDASQVCPGAFATTAPAAGVNNAFTVEGQARIFNLRLPDAQKFSGPRPLLVYFHGTGLSGKVIDTFSFADRLLAAGGIVVAPNGEDNGSVWPAWDGMRQANDTTRKNLDLALFDALVDCLAAHFEIDENRIFVAGHSAGGIMTNRVLRERSKLVAGGVVASGVYDLTDPVTTTDPLAPVAVLVTWGGDNDEYSGSSGGTTVPKFNFAEQAAIASKAYEEAAGVNQVHCRGANVGHAWLDDVDDVMLDFLLAHPKGDADNAGWTLRPAGAAAKSVCSVDAAVFTAPLEVTCPAGTQQADCQDYCQRLGDCAIENNTLHPVLLNELKALGFSGTDETDCGGCVTQCESDAQTGGSVDDTVLACFKTELAKVPCAPGIAGAQGIVAPLAACCDKQTSSEVCKRFCTEIKKNLVASAFFPVCAQF